MMTALSDDSHKFEKSQIQFKKQFAFSATIECQMANGKGPFMRKKSSLEQGCIRNKDQI